jgi:hypothetical protein
MLTETVESLFNTQRSRPLSVAVTIAALVLPSFLVVFLSAPELVFRIGLNGTLLLCVAISLPIVLLCFALWYTPVKFLIYAQKSLAGQKSGYSSGDIAKDLNAEEHLEWPLLHSASWTATLLLYIVAALAYRHPLRIGATYLFLSAILFVTWLIALVGSLVLANALEKKLRAQRTA